MLDGNYKYGLINKPVPRDEDTWQKRAREMKEGKDLCKCMAGMKGKWQTVEGKWVYMCVRCGKNVY